MYEKSVFKESPSLKEVGFILETHDKIPLLIILFYFKDYQTQKCDEYMNK